MGMYVNTNILIICIYIYDYVITLYIAHASIDRWISDCSRYKVTPRAASCPSFERAGSWDGMIHYKLMICDDTCRYVFIVFFLNGVFIYQTFHHFIIW